ncbi:MAG: hypothetical protein HYR62_05245 [Actinobacteria bacterium]|nr:hypothetical protein [Actinomycetota bacterium]MBI3688447.1 hypothetical protein [Actinomycetota bacterium]
MPPPPTQTIKGPLDGWPGLTASTHTFTVDHATLRQVGRALQNTAASAAAAGRTLVAPPPAAWGSWDSASRTRAACEEAMRCLVSAYDQLVREYRAAGQLLLRTAQTYQKSEPRR